MQSKVRRGYCECDDIICEAAVQNLCSKQDETILRLKTNEGPIERHGAQKTLVGRIAGKLVEICCINFVRMLVYIRRAIRNCCLRDTSELDYLCEQLRLNWRWLSEQSFGGAIDISEGEFVVPLIPFSLIGVGVYKLSFTSKCMVLVELADKAF